MEPITATRTLMVIFTIAAVTIFTRAFPFIFFSGKGEPPEFIIYLGKVLPPAIMAMLVIYCLKGISLAQYPYGAPEIIACLTVIILHVWKRNNLISIFGGTILYMILIQIVFV